MKKKSCLYILNLFTAFLFKYLLSLKDIDNTNNAVKLQLTMNSHDTQQVSLMLEAGFGFTNKYLIN